MRNETLFSEKTLRAFEKLKISMYDVTEATKTFGEAIKSSNQKRFLKHAKIETKISDVNVEIGEFLFDEGFICDGCSLHPNNCEGSNCGTQMDAFFSSKTKDEIQKIYFKAIGDKFYNLSRKIKNELKK